MNSNFQIYNNLTEYVDMSGHIDFAETLVNKYKWDDDVKITLSSQLKLIRDKQKDNCLNLSVIGEFSTGKSSFINALLGEKLLVSSVIQGTTVVNTIIEYYSSPILYILKKDGTYDVVTACDVEDLSRRLSSVTTNSETAKAIKLVRVGLPSLLLAQGIRIIDTPGTNSTESWHEDVTKDAIKNLSDLSIILTDAIHPLPQTLIDFVDENLSEVSAQCCVVVTYYDKLRKNDRQDTLSYISRKLHSDLEIEESNVFPYIAPAVLASKNGEKIMPEQDELVRISYESSSALIEMMWRNRQISQIKKLLTLTTNAFILLEQNIQRQKNDYDKEYQLLLKTKQISLEPFVDEEKQLYIKRFRHNVSDIKDGLISSIGSGISTSKIQINSSIMASKATTADDIKNYITTEVPKLCNHQAIVIAGSLDTASQSLLKAFTNVMASYHKDFESQFRKLGVLRIDIGSISMSTPKVQSVSFSSLKESLDYMSEEVSRENWAMGTGGVAGAAIGTAIMPGIGTVVGGLLGMFVGAINTPSADEMKKNACDKLSGSLDSVFLSIERDIIASFNDNVAIYISAIQREIDRYLDKYKFSVDRRIAEHNSLIERNQKQTSRMMTDLKLINLRRNQLKTLSETLN